jgi:hypothetical protein
MVSQKVAVVSTSVHTERECASTGSRRSARRRTSAQVWSTVCKEGVPSRKGLVKAAQGAQRLRVAALEACCGRGEVCAQLTSFSGIDEASLSQDSSLRFH